VWWNTSLGENNWRGNTTFLITIGSHERSTLGLLSLSLVMVEITRHIQDEVPYCMLFVKVSVRTREEICPKIETWWEALKFKWFRISRTKARYVECKFSNIVRKNNSIVQIDGQKIPQDVHFPCLGSNIHHK